MNNLKRNKKPIARISAKNIMEDFKKEEVSVFQNLNFRHHVLLGKLLEIEGRLHNSTISLGREYPLKENKIIESPTDDNHISNYVTHLNYMENTLTNMFNHIEKLEYLVCK